MNDSEQSIVEEQTHTMPGAAMQEDLGVFSRAQPSRSAIADAVASRLSLQAVGSSETSNEDVKRQSEFKAKIRKLINELTASVNYEKSSACLRLTYTLLGNILQNPKEAKYRSFKATQAKISRDILSLEEGKALLVEIGFRTRTHEFQQEWFIPEDWKENSLGMKKVDWARGLVNIKMQEFEENAERARFHKEKERAFEANRKNRALEEAREDRERVAMRAERERLIRAAETRAEAVKKEEEVRARQLQVDEDENKAE